MHPQIPTQLTCMEAAALLCFIRVSEFTGLEWWNGMVEWTGIVEWTGMVDRGIMEQKGKINHYGSWS